MAIDDNASYELTGYQVKDLAQKIRAKADSNSLASVATSGLYSDLTGAPTIPTVYNGTLTIQQNGTQLGTFSANQSSDTTINITGGGGTTYTAGNGINIDADNEISIDDTVVAEVSDLPTDFTGATSSTAGANGLVPAPSAGDEDKVLKGDGTWQDGYDRVALYITNMPADLTTPFYIYKDSSRQQPITWSEMRDLLKVSSGKEVVLWLNNSGDDIYHVVKYCDDTTEFYIVDPDTTAYYYIQNNSGDSTQTQFSIESVDLQRELTAGSNITISNGTISATDTTYSDFTGATSSVAGSDGLVPAPAAGDEGKALHGDGTWKDTTAKLVEMSYGEANAWTKFINAYNAGSIVYCRASSNANPATGSQTRKAFMAYVNNATSPTSVEFQYVRSVSSKTEAQPVDQVFVYTLTNTNGGTWSVASRNMGPKIAAGTGINVSYSNGTYTISLA